MFTKKTLKKTMIKFAKIIVDKFINLDISILYLLKILYLKILFHSRIENKLKYDL